VDGVVNIADFSVVSANFNSPGIWATGDFGYDGMVSLADYAVLAANFNASLSRGGVAPDAAVPEPATTVLFSLTAAGLLARRRR
jgi:hypothetical protein